MATGTTATAASMRPGRVAPDNHWLEDFLGADRSASMRPGRVAPDNNLLSRGYSIEQAASMRPGRVAPDNEIRDWLTPDISALQ